MWRRIASGAFWAFLASSSILLFPVALLLWAATAPFDRRKVLLHRFTCFWASLYTWANPAWLLRISGRDRIQPGQTYVMVANHLSLLDILVLFRLFRHFKWVSKIENFRIPFVGWNMSLNGYVKLKRGDRESVLQMLEACRRTLARGSSIMMFPEGTRSPDGRMREFKTGAFQLALEQNLSILPIAIQGTAAALPKRGFVLQGRHPIRVTLLEPLQPALFTGWDAAQLAKETRERIRAVVEEPAGAGVLERPRLEDSDG